MAETPQQFAVRFRQLASRGLRHELRRMGIRIALTAEAHSKVLATQRLRVRSGRLRSSIAGSVAESRTGIQVRLSAGGRIGGADVRYAATQEGPESGAAFTIIRAKSGKALAIPVHPSLFTAAGVSRYPGPRSVPNLWMDKRGGRPPVLRNTETGEVFYVLRSSVRIPAKRFLRDGLRSATETVPAEYNRLVRQVVLGG